MQPITRTRAVISPFDSLYDMRREVDRLLSTFSEGGSENGLGHVPVEMHETEGEFRYTFEVPGVSAEDLDVTVENGVLSVSGEKKFEDRREEGEYRLFERRYGRFERSFRLPRNVDPERVNARCENGLLEVTLPKAESARPRKIQIEGSKGGREVGSGQAT